MSGTNGVPTSPQREIEGIQARYTPEQWEAFMGVVHNVTSIRRDWMKSLTDPRRDLEDACGYPRLTEAISIDLYKQLYDRDAIGARVVEIMPKESWQVQPMVYEDEDEKNITEFEEAWDNLGNDLVSAGTTWFKMEAGSPIWEYMLRGDILSGIGHFGVLLLGVDDGRNLQEPADGVVVVNRKVEPVYDDRPVRNSDGRIVRNEDGTPKLQNVQVGARIKNEYGPMVRDSFMSKAEEEALKNPKPIEVTRNGKKEKITPPPLNEMEEQIVKGWAKEREDYLHNAASEANGVSNAASDAVGYGPKYGGTGYLDPNSRPAGTPPVGSSSATLSGDAARREIQGTDQQYMTGLNMPPFALSGTDQQYYGVIFGPTEQPAEDVSKEKRKLLFVRCFDESLLQIVRYEWNIRNPRFGMPVMYRVTLNDPREQHSGIGLPLATVFVHWSRLVHIADHSAAANSSEIFAKPRMQQVLNNILGLRKLYCGSPEMFWRGAFPGLALSTHPQLGGDVEIDREAARNQMEQYYGDLQRYLLLTGMSAQTLAPSVADPTAHIAAQIEAICIKLACPKRVFMGSERGELASSQDDSQWNDVKRARQNGYITPRVIVPFIDRCIQLGLLPEPESYYVEWPDLEALADKDKATIGLTVTQALAAYMSGGVESIMTPEDYLAYVFKGLFSDEEIQEITKAAQKAEEEKQQENEDLAQEHGMVPAPPPGFKHPEPPPPAPGAVKMKPGEALVHPQTGKVIGGPPAPNPNAPPNPAAKTTAPKEGA